MADSELYELARDLDGCCRLHGEFVLRSGRTAAEYFDKYLFESDPQLLYSRSRPRPSRWPTPTGRSGTGPTGSRVSPDRGRDGAPGRPAT